MNLATIRMIVQASNTVTEARVAERDAQVILSRVSAEDVPEYFEIDGSLYRCTKRPLLAERLNVVNAHQMKIDELG